MSFVQVSTSTRAVLGQSSRMDSAANAITDVAATHRDMVLGSLSMYVRLDSFTVDIKAMDGMTGQLKQEQADEVVRHDTCPKDFDTNGSNWKANRNEHRLFSNSLQGAQCEEGASQNEEEGSSRGRRKSARSKQAGVWNSSFRRAEQRIPTCT